MNCARYDHTAIYTVAHSPVSGVWEVYGCRRCFYIWRSTEQIGRAHV